MKKPIAFACSIVGDQLTAGLPCYTEDDVASAFQLAAAKLKEKVVVFEASGVVCEDMHEWQIMAIEVEEGFTTDATYGV